MMWKKNREWVGRQVVNVQEQTFRIEKELQAQQLLPSPMSYGSVIKDTIFLPAALKELSDKIDAIAKHLGGELTKENVSPRWVGKDIFVKDHHGEWHPKDK